LRALDTTSTTAAVARFSFSFITGTLMSSFTLDVDVVCCCPLIEETLENKKDDFDLTKNKSNAKNLYLLLYHTLLRSH